MFVWCGLKPHSCSAKELDQSRDAPDKRRQFRSSWQTNAGQSLGACKDPRLGVVEHGACPPSTAQLQILIYPTARLTFRQALEYFWHSFDEDFSMTSSTKRLCVFPINGGLLFPPLLLFPHTFPENLHSFNSFERTCGSLHSALCDVVNPRSDLQ